MSSLTCTASQLPFCSASGSHNGCWRTSLVPLLLLVLSGCGGATPDSGDGSFFTELESSPADGATGSNVTSPATAPVVDYAVYTTAVRRATEQLAGMSAEYEGVIGSGQSSVELKQTEVMYQLLRPVGEEISRTAVPPADVAQRLKQEVLPQLLEGIKRAEMADLRFSREYQTSSFGVFRSSGGHEISDGIRIAKNILNRLQEQLPLADRLTTGPPPTIGGPPPANRSFGHLRSQGLNPVGTMSSFGSKPEPIPWRMAVDPPRFPYQLPEGTKFDIEFPGSDAQPTAFYNPVNMLYPHMPSLVVGLGLNEATAQQRQIWQLEPRQRIGIVRRLQLLKSDLLALSPDGLYFAGRPEGTSVIGLYDVKKGEPVKQTMVEFEQGRDHWLLFAADNHLVYLTPTQASVWSVPELKLEREISLTPQLKTSSWNPGHPWTISPGGRYLAIPTSTGWDSAILFYDVTTGEKAARINLVGLQHLQQIACNFSKDGNQLAVLAESPWNTWIQVWDLASGQITNAFTTDQSVNRAVKGDTKYQGPAVDWFPDGRHIILYGKGIFNVETGQGTRLIADTVRYRLNPLSSTQVGAIVRKKYVGFNLEDIPENPTRWETLALANETQVADNPFEVAPQGAKPLPQRVDRSELRYINRPTATLWQITPDAASSTAGGTVSIPGFTKDNVYHAAVSANQSRGVVGYSSPQVQTWSGKVSNLDKLKTWVESVALPSGTAPERFDFPFPSGFAAVSPSGQRILTIDFDGFSRFDLWDVNGQQHLLGLIPYAQGRSDGGAPILWADFATENRVLTLADGQLTCWDIDAGKALYELALPTPACWPAFSAGRKYLAITDPQAVTVIETASGAVVGFQDQFTLQGELAAAAFSPDGSHLAILSAPNGGGEVAVFNLASGNRETHFPLPLSGKTLEWVHPDFVLVDGAFGVSLSKQAVAWIYHLNGTRIASGTGTQRFFLAQEQSGQPLALKTSTIPGTDVLTALESQSPPNEIVLQAGGSLAIDLQIPSPPGRSNFTDEVRRSLTDKFAANSIQIDNSAPLTLVIRGTQEKTGGGISLGRGVGGSFSNRSDIDEERVTWTLSIKQENQTLWQRSLSANNTGSVKLDDNASGQAAITQAAQQLQERMWQNAANQLLNFTVPKYVFGPQAGTGLGSTQLHQP